MIGPIIFILILAFIVYLAIAVRKKDGNETYSNKVEYGDSFNNETDETPKKKIKLPYRVSDSVLTDAEKSFYHALKLFLKDRAVVCPKIGLKDLFFISKEAGNDYMKYFGKIAQKHVDFLLCDPLTMKPLCAIELDDFSHTSKKSFERDQFIGKLYKDAGLELIRVSSKSGYTANEIEMALMGVFDKRETVEPDKVDTKEHDQTPICPKCNIPMVMRTASKGKYEGKVFWGCPNFPKCRETVSSGT